MHKNKTRFVYFLSALFLMSLVGGLKAEPSISAPAQLSNISNEKVEVESNQKEIRDDLAKARIGNQQEELAKKEVDLNKRIYERTRKAYGSKNSLTKEARERYEQAKVIYSDTRRENRAVQEEVVQNRNERERRERALSDGQTNDLNSSH
jgi:hypothetical protein